MRVFISPVYISMLIGGGVCLTSVAVSASLLGPTPSVYEILITLLMSCLFGLLTGLLVLPDVADLMEETDP